MRTSIYALPIIANTAQVHPGHRGIVSLTLTSNAEFSVKLYPGMRIAELQLRHIDSLTESPKHSRYHFMTRPLHTELHRDPDLKYLGPMVEPIIVGIVSTIASGRTTAITYLTETYGLDRFSLADGLKDEARRIGVSPLRNSLQDLGSSLRETHGNAYLANKLLNSVKWLANRNNLVIVDSFKNIAEVEEFKKQLRFTLLGIDAPFDQRWERVKNRRRQGDPTEYDDFVLQDATDRGIYSSLPHSQQVEQLLKGANLLIYNDGSTAQFHEKLDDFMKKLL